MKLGAICGVGLFLALGTSTASAQADQDRCSPAAIRRAYDQQISPDLHDCQINQVMGPLREFFNLSKPRTRDDSSPAETIIDQAPGARQPLAHGDRLTLTLSTGIVPKNEPTPVQPAPVEPTPAQPAPAQPTPAQPAPIQPTPVQPVPVQPSPANPSPVQPSPFQPSPVIPPPVNPPPVKPPGDHGLLYLVLAALALTGAGLAATRWFKADPAGLPSVHCAFEYAAPRIARKGPLVTGPPLRIGLEFERGAAKTTSIDVLSRGSIT